MGMNPIDLALWLLLALCVLLLLWPFAVYPLILRLLPVRAVAKKARTCRRS